MRARASRMKLRSPPAPGNPKGASTETRVWKCSRWGHYRVAAGCDNSHAKDALLDEGPCMIGSLVHRSQMTVTEDIDEWRVSGH
jgi:hypothetical protein